MENRLLIGVYFFRIYGKSCGSNLNILIRISILRYDCINLQCLYRTYLFLKFHSMEMCHILLFSSIVESL